MFSSFILLNLIITIFAIKPSHWKKGCVCWHKLARSLRYVFSRYISYPVISAQTSPNPFRTHGAIVCTGIYECGMLHASILQTGEAEPQCGWPTWGSLAILVVRSLVVYWRRKMKSPGSWGQYCMLQICGSIMLLMFPVLWNRRVWWFVCIKRASLR